MGPAEKYSSPISDRQSGTELDAGALRQKSDNESDDVRKKGEKKNGRWSGRLTGGSCSPGEEDNKRGRVGRLLATWALRRGGSERERDG